MNPSLDDLTRFLDEYLRVRDIPDDPRALNGLQVSRAGPVTRVIAAVDVCAATIEAAHVRRGDFLLVHHGLFWGGLQRIAGAYGNRVRSLIEHGIALYSAHLPLDCHPVVGNNALLAGELGLTDLKPFGRFEGIEIGVQGSYSGTLEMLGHRLFQVLGSAPRIVAVRGPGIGRVGIVTGAGSSALAEAATAGIQVLVTGEAPHHAYLDAEELGVTLILAGHYATETFGVRALARVVADRFQLPWEFVDHPTGL